MIFFLEVVAKENKWTAEYHYDYEGHHNCKLWNEYCSSKWIELPLAHYLIPSNLGRVLFIRLLLCISEFRESPEGYLHH